MTWFGFVIHGVQYLGGCQTRYGTYPYCESMRVPSYSTAKSAFASLALMRLGQKYDSSVPDLLIRDYLPETADSPGNWEEVTFDHTLDMATGNFQTSQRMVDEEKWNTDPFWLEDYYKERIQAALDWPSSAPPGTVWVYRTSDTFVLTAAMQNFLQEVEGSQADIFHWMVNEVYEPLGMGPGFFSTVRTRNDNWNGLPVGGYGLWWIPDDLAKLSTFLGLNEGNINHQVILDPAQLGAALQKDPADRGVVRDGDGRYNNGFWADQYTSPTDPGCTFWVPHMYGYSGIVVAIIPNGTVYYYASDNQEFTTSRAIQESVKLIPVCSD
jgi:CubicO group peptidase (beta-lactamase class C family)